MRRFLTFATTVAVTILSSTVISPSVAEVADNQPNEHVQAKIRRGEVPVRSTNLGGWLVAEYWMSMGSTLWTNVPAETATQGEYAVMTLLGNKTGTTAFERHRDTWIREDDIRQIAEQGLNTVRVPVGYWVIRDALQDGVSLPPTFSPQIDHYARGSLKYLDTLINSWAITHNVSVMISFHGHQGSQNGYDHSAPSSPNVTSWSTLPDNVKSSVYVVGFLADRYKDSPSFLGMTVMNEPRLPTDRTVLDKFYKDAYTRVRNTGNNCILTFMPFVSEQDANHLVGMLDSPNYTNVWHELHSFFVWGYKGISADGLLATVDGYWGSTLASATASNRPPLFIGEMSMGSPNGTFSGALDKFRCFGARQMAIFNKIPRGGWSFWTWRHSDEDFNARNGWAMRKLLKDGDLVLTGGSECR